ncbi:matrixin family metalloprotease [Weissella confusa]|uniref:matrixin family metalloprotease n=1 Tax=Weissella confusa TaxID=1583 RepID=UPI0022DF3FE2|nr:matrixin family metalloprotease [Weissella confusa]
MKFIKGLASLALGTLVLANATIANAATWAYSNLNASDTVVAYSADYPTQTAAAGAYWNSIAGTTVVAVTNNQADATVTIEKKDTPAGDADPNVALTYAPNGITDIYPSRIASQGVDLQTVITHELGHSLGLDHDAGSTLMAPAGGQLGGQAHDYQALKADLASHGRQLDNPAYEASTASSQTSAASSEKSVSEKRTSNETASAPEQEPSETTSTEVTETTTSQIAGSATVTRDATSVKPSSATVSVESLPEPTKAGNQGGRLQQEVKVVIHKVSDALATK